MAGTPQVLVPVHFDQHFHAERVAFLGLAAPPLQAALLFGEAAEDEGEEADEARAVQALTDALRVALHPDTREACTAFAQV